MAERIHDGLGVSPGIAIGPAHVFEAGRVQIPEYALKKSEVADELARFRAALAGSDVQLKKLKAKAAALPGATSEELGFLLDAHRQMLSGSRLVRGVEKVIEERRINAEAAVQREIEDIAGQFAEMDDAYLASRAQDIRDVGDRLQRNLTKEPAHGFEMLEAGSVILAEELSPADTALMDPERVAGFATALGGAESHTAIMARSLGLPAVSGAADVILTAAGSQVIVDGNAGKVIVEPSAATLKRYRQRQQANAREIRRLTRLRDVAAVTLDGTPITLQANLELPRELDTALAAGAEGIGLLRTEFTFMNRADLPGEDEQYEALRALVVGMRGRPVTVRTLDVGGDKLAYSLETHLGESANPALGLRAIRLSLKVPKLLETQLAAMLRAGAHGRLRILLPMITGVAEVRQVREALNRVARRLRRRRVEIADPLPPLGVMIEIPGAALSADALARSADFFAIGTNDLVMYTLAIDRAEEQVAHLYNPLHPACLRMIQFATEAALRARLPISLCGEIAGDPRYTALLLGLGIRELSMTAASLPRVKQRILGIDLIAATQRARMIMDQVDHGRIATLIDDFNALA